MKNMMNSTRNTKRVIGLGLAALSMSLMGTPSQAADNNTVGNAILLPMNTGLYNNVVTLNDKKFFATEVFAGRSYEISIYPVGVNIFSNSPANFVVRSATSQAFTTLDTVTANTGPKEGSFNTAGSGCCWTYAGTFTPATSGIRYLEVSTSFSTGYTYISIRETTLFSPWLSKAAGFEGFIELHNNTNAAVSVTLKAYDSTGTIQGAGLTVSIPGNATVFQTGASIGVPVDVAAGVVLTHNGSFGAISGNITTLNGANGLSFDSAFTSRSELFRQH